MAHELQEHLDQVLEHEVPCSEWHQEAFDELTEIYKSDSIYLTEKLASDVVPPQIVVSGEGLSTYIDMLRSGGGVYVGDIGTTMVTLERWATDGEKLVRFSKSSESHQWGELTRLAAKQFQNKWGIIPGLRARRTDRLARAALQSPAMFLDEFTAPETIDDEMFWGMRQLDSMLDHQDEAPSEFQRVGGTVLVDRLLQDRDPEAINEEAIDLAQSQTAQELAEKKLGPAPEMSEEDKRWPLESDRFLWACNVAIEASRVEQTAAPDEATIEYYRQRLIHQPIHSLHAAVEGLRRVVPVVCYGRQIMPSRPQHEISTCTSIASLRGAGSQITISIF